MNILLINHYAGSPKYGMEYHLYYLAGEWVKLGHQVAIVAASFSHLRSQLPMINEEVTEEKIDGITYLWLETLQYHHNNIRRVFNMLTFILHLVKIKRKLVKEIKPDVMIVS